MDIVVHGTKGGRQIFTPKKLGGLLDVNSDTSKASAIGQEAYAIRFVEKTIIFSKYKIIRDVRGDKRTGFLAFSLFLPNNKRLHGTDILSILNKVSEEYCKRYIPENDNNLKDVREDWAFLDRISGEYKTMLRPVSSEDIENLLSGTKDDAFIYYENDEKIQKYFDAPYHDEYNQYRQVLFVKDKLKDKPESPLNALRHSENPNDNLTGKIDLDKKEYALRDYDGQAKNGISIEIRVRGKLLYKKDKINNKDLISIRYFRKYSKELVVKEGRLNDEWIRRYLFVDEENRKIDVEKNINLDPVKKTITFIIKDWEKKAVNGAKIGCQNAGGEIPIENYNQATFKGDDLGKRWWVSANNDRFFSEERQIDFDKDCPGDASSIDIVLNKHKLEITAIDDLNGDILDKVNVIINKTEFTGSEIKDKHKITVSCKGFDPYPFEYCPADDKRPIRIPLKRRQQGNFTESGFKYTASVGEHGTWKDGSSNDRFTRSSGGYDLKHLIKEDKGYEFTRFEEHGTTLVAQYDKKKYIYQKPKFIAGLIVVAILIVFGVLALYTFPGKDQSKQPQQPTVQHIMAYIKGDSLILETLNSYKNIPGIEQKEVLDSLDNAIKKRKVIDSLNFSELKKLFYFQEQKKFETWIKNIDSTRYDYVKIRLGNVSSWSLDKIADSIKAVLNTTKPAAENKPEIKKEAKEEKEEEPKKEVTQPAKPEQKKEETPKEIKQPAKSEQIKEEKPVSPAAKMDKTTEIIQYLKGDELKKDVLNKYLKEAGNNASLIKSIRLCLSLWSLNGQKNNDYCSIYENCAKDNNLKETNITKILKTLCDKTDVNYAGLSNATDILSKLKAKK